MKIFSIYNEITLKQRIYSVEQPKLPLCCHMEVKSTIILSAMICACMTIHEHGFHTHTRNPYPKPPKIGYETQTQFIFPFFKLINVFLFKYFILNGCECMDMTLAKKNILYYEPIMVAYY